ncbi:Glycosyltransferase, catalytic subunit of cellulose synthase and poly-beta-1,6-N-acetylglucosamine synthase [Psychroflexus halocasei]|uniref:Glycosyltransferase, catalytic subunit of cellulose synthase and poly-beta-1,6-N-acetylglucosamine synthase n=2 Tax=Psychroflexus halocasei TaxID=908615 RepID=A0A1H4D2G5_9FLAO|nr:Glycosyltransferase, catalytic subunit of cellulose synthase and poly-beta-1,6-N-acetylglucosamine synthase [Psychroflexus halocasei]
MIIFSAIAILYFLTIGWAIRKISNFKFSEQKFNSDSELTRFSVLISFRNEANNLPKLLQSVSEIDYPLDKFELILIDDHSSDMSRTEMIDLINKFDMNIRLFHLSDVGLSTKKQAVKYGVSQASGEYVLTTDADCVLPNGILKAHHLQIIDQQPDLIAGAVSFIKKNTFLSQFQYYDFMAIQAVSMSCMIHGKPIANNAAHMSFKRSVFLKLNPYQNNMNIASGDDVFLLERFIQMERKIRYLEFPEIVLSASQESFSALVQQRKRWFLKSKYVKNRTAKRIGLILFLGQINMVFGFILLFFLNQIELIFSLFIIVKFIIDYRLLNQFSKKFHLGFCAKELLLFYIVYPFSLFIFIFALANQNYSWKSRQFKI